MTAPIATTTLFADVSGSTRLFEQRGDVLARQLIAAVLAALTEVCGHHGGRVIKTIGDEIMCTFPTPLQGLLAAVDMQRCLGLDVVFSAEKIAIRIGLHHGDVLFEDGDVYGDAVNVAARMATLAKREQIVATASTVAGLGNGAGLRTRTLPPAHVAGKLLPIDVVDVLWQDDTAHLTMVQRAVRLDDPVPPRARLLLRYRGQMIELATQSAPFMLGRDAGNGLVVEAEWVSRNHALIEYKRGHFVLSDRSTNGTWIKLGEGGDELRMHCDAVHLRRNGCISLGQAVAAGREHLLHFECVEA